MDGRQGKGQSTKQPKHGTESTYTNWGCRCWRCRKGHAVAQRAARLRRKARLEGAA